RTLIHAADRVLDASVVKDELQRLVPFPVELRPVPAPRERGAERVCRVARAYRRLSRQCGGDVLTSAPMKVSDGTKFALRCQLWSLLCYAGHGTPPGITPGLSH